MEHLSFSCPGCLKAVSLTDNYCQKCGERLMSVQINAVGVTAVTESVADKETEPAPYLVSPISAPPRPVRWPSPESDSPEEYARRASDRVVSPIAPPRRNMSRLLYNVTSDFDAPVDPCEVTINLTQAELYASGSYRKPHAPKTDSRALIDMCVQLSAVALAVLTVGFSTEKILYPQGDRVSQTFNSAETLLLSKHPERAADILSAIPAGTPCLTPERARIFNRALLARARTKTQLGLYPEALYDLNRIASNSPEAVQAERLLQECRNLQAFDADIKEGFRMSTNPGVDVPTSAVVEPIAAGYMRSGSQSAALPVQSALSSAQPNVVPTASTAPLARTNRTPLAVSALPTRATSLPPAAPASGETAQATAPAPEVVQAPVTHAAANHAAATAVSAAPTKPRRAVAAETATAPAASGLPPQLLPASDSTSYWLQETASTPDESPSTANGAAASDDGIPASEPGFKPSAEASPAVLQKHDWKTAPQSGNRRFADK